MRWYLRSIRDQDTHRGDLQPEGLVAALCGITFTPYLLPQGGIALPRHPQDPDQICPECARVLENRRNAQKPERRKSP